MLLLRMVIFRHQSRKNRAIMKNTPLKILSCFKIFFFSGLTPYEHRKKCNLQTILLQKVPSLFQTRWHFLYYFFSKPIAKPRRKWILDCSQVSLRNSRASRLLPPTAALEGKSEAAACRCLAIHP